MVKKSGKSSRSSGARKNSARSKSSAKGSARTGARNNARNNGKTSGAARAKFTGMNAARAVSIAPSRTSHSDNGHFAQQTRNDLAHKTRTQVCELLNKTLADTLDLKTQIKQAHWNVKGVHFYQLHLLFDEIAGDIEEYSDLFAERITSLAGTALGTARVAAKNSRLPEYPLHITEGMDHVVALAERLSAYGKLVRKNIDDTDKLGDADTADIYTEVSRAVDKWLWFIEAHLQAPTAARETTKSARR